MAITDAVVEWLLERYKSEAVAGIESVLSEIGEERIRFLVDSDTTLWSVWPNKEKSLARLLPYVVQYRDVIGRIDLSELAKRTLNLLAERDSPFAFIPEPWLVKNLREVRREILADVLK